MSQPETKNKDKEVDAEKQKSRVMKLYIRGTISNSIAMSLLFSIAYFLNLHLYVGVALGIQIGVFAVHGLPFSSEKFYDLSGSFTHLALVATALLSERRMRSPRQLFVAVASVIWMTRLGTFLYNRILKDGKDERFDNLKQVWLAFLGAWTIQAVWVTLVQLPVVLLNIIDDTAPCTPLDVVGMLLWFTGFLCEAAADTQKMAFRNDPANKSKYITSGLWQYSRHPNYFGEILMWSSMALLSSTAAVQLGIGALHAGWISPLFTTVLLLKVSGVAMVEAAGEKKWGTEPAYRNYMDNTSCVIPWHPAPPLEAAKKD